MNQRNLKQFFPVVYLAHKISAKIILLFGLTFFIGSAFAQEYKITVAQDGSGDYKTIQQAIDIGKARSEPNVVIYIKNGVYKEKLVIPAAGTIISLVGESRKQTIITNDNYSGQLIPGTESSEKKTYGTSTSYTLLIQNDNCILKNLTIQNSAGRVGQAVALATEGDKIQVLDCDILGNQDTLYTKAEGRNFFKNCLIAGTTDFIFGSATVLFDHCTIKSLSDSFITAAATPEGQKFGYVFMNCKLIAVENATKVFLGRPWRPYARTVFINTEMDSHILKQGWDPWKGDSRFPDKEKTTYYAEYNSTGAGGDSSSRVSWSKQLTKEQAAEYKTTNILSGWLPSGI